MEWSEARYGMGREGAQGGLLVAIPVLGRLWEEGRGVGVGHTAPHCHGNRLMGLGSAGAERDVSLIQLSQLGRGGWVSLQQAHYPVWG